MMISGKMNKALNEQVTNELGASHRYLAMAYSFDHMGLRIFAQHFIKQSDEERMHAMKIAKYISDVGGEVVIGPIAPTKGTFNSAKAIVKAALESELTVTGQINDLVALSEKEKDYATNSFLRWFVDEQVEEVSSMTELLQLITMAGDSNLFAVETRLAAAKLEPGDAD
jgi:ferritin